MHDPAAGARGDLGPRGPDDEQAAHVHLFRVERPERGHRQRLLGRPHGAPDDDDARALLPHLGRIALIEIAFPKFRDGRGYSAARILRDHKSQAALADTAVVELAMTYGQPSIPAALARLKATQLSVNAAAMLTLDRADLAATLDEALVMNAVELLALIVRMRAMTLDYLKTRMQFGKAIGSFQSLQHRSADMLMQEELTRAVVGQAVARGLRQHRTAAGQDAERRHQARQTGGSDAHRLEFDLAQAPALTRRAG